MEAPSPSVSRQPAFCALMTTQRIVADQGSRVEESVTLSKRSNSRKDAAPADRCRRFRERVLGSGEIVILPDRGHPQRFLPTSLNPRLAVRPASPPFPSMAGRENDVGDSRSGGSSIVYRLAGAGAVGATLRVYIECYKFAGKAPRRGRTEDARRPHRAVALAGGDRAAHGTEGAERGDDGRSGSARGAPAIARAGVVAIGHEKGARNLPLNSARGCEDAQVVDEKPERRANCTHGRRSHPPQCGGLSKLRMTKES